ncbi:hypothetical protein O6R05_01405 [Peptoniphilus equinus]|uniref:Lipoprotein n=1 Tax=Peptoniphilus equinus TaxID=3016343 RepID=A0ABY7QTX5_9FIRM|nr:hypothetical protein [Peptoniphilus equinus]WBW50226.1 hypothetical protein O6R05_01405 [Peptoniphilus equinus]
MKKNIVALLMCALLLSACGKGDKATNDTEIKSTDSSNVEVLTKNEGNAAAANAKNSDRSDEKTTATDADETKVDADELSSLAEHADYISHVRITAAADAQDITYLEDYKGDLSNIAMELPKGVKSDREYLLFYIDGADGKIQPVAEDSAFIELEGSDDERLAYIKKTFKKETPSVERKTTTDLTDNAKADATKDAEESTRTLTTKSK